MTLSVLRPAPWALAALLCLPGVAARAGAASFSAGPTAERAGGKAAVSFAASAATNVEVAVLDAEGKVVRHLAAGLLGGEKAPPPPLKPGLTQSLEWDGQDDCGKPAAGGGFKFRVRLGVRADFEQAVSIKVFNEKSVRYGQGGVDSSGELIEMTNPVFRYGTKPHSPDPSKVMFYAGTTRIDMVVSDQTDEILLQCWSSGGLGAWKDVPIARFDGLTGKFIAVLPKDRDAWNKKFGAFGKGEPVMDWFGKYFLHDGYGWDVVRLTLDGKPLNFNGGTNVFTLRKRFRRHVHQRGMAVGPDGNIYVAEIAPSKDKSDIVAYQSCFVSKLDENGKLLEDSLIQVYAPIVQGVRLDPAGNIFVGVGVKEAGKPVPEEIAGKLKGGPADPLSQACWAPALYGSIVKFGPEGGKILPDPKGTLTSCGGNNARETAVSGQGLKWIHYGASFQPTHNGKVNLCCYCFTPRFDVDHFGRVLFPNPFQNEFKVLDNEGSLLFRVRNSDLAGKAKVGCGTTVQATDRGIYVADHPNNQILIFRWKPEAEKLVDLP